MVPVYGTSGSLQLTEFTWRGLAPARRTRFQLLLFTSISVNLPGHTAPNKMLLTQEKDNGQLLNLAT